MAAYAEFAKIYDRLMDDFDYPAWAEYYLKLTEGCNPKRICDCACGTGSLTVEYAKSIPEVIGSDISAEMLEVAAEKAREQGVSPRWLRADMCALQVGKSVDAVLCGCDGVNYLTTIKRVETFFKAAYTCIRPGGMFAFDVSTPYKLKEMMGDAFFGEERDDIAYLWQNTLEGENVTMDLTFFVREPNGLYRRFTETHRQRAHSEAELTTLLEKTGFAGIRVYGDQTFEAPGAEEVRMHFVCVRP